MIRELNKRQRSSAWKRFRVENDCSSGKPLDVGSGSDFDEHRRHCLPSIPEIVAKVLAVTARAPHLTRVYVITNAEHPWLEELTAALRTAHHWADGIGTSRDLQLSWEGKFVAEALDVYVGKRAEMFIGNGFSSLSSNVVALRMHNPDLRPRMLFDVERGGGQCGDRGIEDMGEKENAEDKRRRVLLCPASS
ncbi:hypothetical protein K438DRAFT_1971153 [Mycena galopus ATCC 62051]|nr:hypothetical protein K438DRAFT_1971153 [Mycena galopus ATCC 62051]